MGLLVVGLILHSWKAAKFPPRDVSTLRRFLRHYIPDAQIESSGEFLEAHRIRREYSGYDDLYTYYLGFSCERASALELIGHGNPLDNSIAIDDSKMALDTDPSERIVLRTVDLSETSTFPDVFFEKLDLKGCDTLLIRKRDAPEWYTPERIAVGLADRCVWGRGRVLIEFYFDADRERMFLRIDELRPE